MEIYPLVHFRYEMPSSYTTATTSAQSAWHDTRQNERTKRDSQSFL